MIVVSMFYPVSFQWRIVPLSEGMNTETAPLTHCPSDSFLCHHQRENTSLGRALLSLLVLGLLSATLPSLESRSQPCIHTHSHAHSRKWQEGSGWMFPLWLFLGSKIIGISASSLWISFVFSKSSTENALFPPKCSKNNNRYIRSENPFYVKTNTLFPLSFSSGATWKSLMFWMNKWMNEWMNEHCSLYKCEHAASVYMLTASVKIVCGSAFASLPVYFLYFC